MKALANRFSNVRHYLLAVLAFVTVIGCSSPEQAADEYYQKGTKLLEKGELEKAKIEFRNALQIKKNMSAAIYGLAKVAEQQGEWQQLFDLLRKVLELEPKNLEARVKLGRLLLAANKLDKALEESNKAYEINKDDSTVLTLRAAIMLKLDDSKGAIENANLALAKAPGDVDALLVLATERFSAGDFAKAVEFLDQGLKSSDKNVALQLIKIQALTKLSKSNEAEEVFKKLIKFYPDSKELRGSLAKFYLANNRKEDAEKELVSLVQSNPTDLEAKLEHVRFVQSIKGVEAARQLIEDYARKEPANYPVQFALVSFYQSRNDMKSGEAVLREVMKQEGNSKDGLIAKGMLAATLMARGEKPGATKLIDEILAQDKRNEQALILRASMAIENRRLDDAIADLRTVLRDVPNSSRAYLLLAKAHEQGSAFELADENYLRGFKTGKMAPAFGLPYAQFLLRRSQPDRAEKILEDMLSTSPGNVAGMRMLAQAKIARADWAGAQAVADQIRRSGNQESVAEQISGAIHAGQQNYSASIASFKKAVEAAPSEVQPMIALVRTYLVAGKTKEAADFLNSVLQSNPSNIAARVMQGQLYAVSGQMPQAIEAFNSVAKIDPKNPVGYQQLAVLYLRSKKNAEADAAINQALALAPQDVGLLMTKAGILELTSRFDEAIKIYEGVLKIKPDADIAANNLASLLSEKTDDKASLDRAYELSQRFSRSDIPQFKDTYGWASYKVGKYEEASAALRSAAEQLPGIPVFHYHLGMNYLALKDVANARKELEKALEFGQNQSFAEAEQARKALQGLK